MSYVSLRTCEIQGLSCAYQKQGFNWRQLDHTRKSRLIDFKKKAQLDSVRLMLEALLGAFSVTISHPAGTNYLCYSQQTENVIHFVFLFTLRKFHNSKLLLIQSQSYIHILTCIYNLHHYMIL